MHAQGDQACRQMRRRPTMRNRACPCFSGNTRTQVMQTDSPVMPTPRGPRRIDPATRHCDSPTQNRFRLILSAMWFQAWRCGKPWPTGENPFGKPAGSRMQESRFRIRESPISVHAARTTINGCGGRPARTSSRLWPDSTRQARLVRLRNAIVVRLWTFVDLVVITVSSAGQVRNRTQPRWPISSAPVRWNASVPAPQ
jgi:hypothetical protein